jgi:dephospho-CoA kinase
MLRVGLTGGIGAGKSTVGRMFVDLGCYLIDADEIVHTLFKPGEMVNRSVVSAFGSRVVDPDGSINRQVLGDIVFRDPSARGLLNNIVHPAVIQRQKEWLDELEVQEPNAIGIVEAALMIEVGTYKNYDKVIVVVCSPEEQRRRLRERSALSEKEIEARISSQMSMENKAKHGDYIIESSGTLEETKRQVGEVYRRLRALVGNSPPSEG